MAIDTKEKRAAIFGVGRPWMRDKLPIATPDEEWRIASGNAYGGNALGVTTYVTTAAGNWSNTGNWTPTPPAGGPGNGSKASLGHSMTVDANTTIGTYVTAGTDAITIDQTAGGKITIATNVTLTVRGEVSNSTPINTADDLVTLDAGATWEWDVPDGEIYNCALGTANSQAGRLQFDGTIGNHCTVTSTTTGTGRGQFVGTFSNNNQFDATYTDFSYLGNSANHGVRTGIIGHGLDVDHCTFDNCGFIRFYRPGATVVFNLTNTTFTNPLGWLLLYFDGYTAPTSGSRTISGCVFDGECDLFSPSELTVTNCIFYEQPIHTNANWALFQNNFIRKSTSTFTNFYGSAKDCYLLYEWVSGTPYGWIFNADRSLTFDGIIIDSQTTSNNWNMFNFSNPANPQTFTVTGCLMLPNADGDWAGAFVNANNSGANVTVDVEHCTFITGGSGSAETGIKVGNYAGHAGLFGSVKSNIGWNPSAGNGYIFYRPATSTVQDLVSTAGCDYNCGHNLAANYFAETDPPSLWSSGTGGANDIDVNPQFVDSSRNLKTWDTSLGGPGTVANAITELMKLNDSDWDSNYNFTALMTYVRDGFKVQNVQLKDAGHDSVTIGAAGYQQSIALIDRGLSRGMARGYRVGMA